MSSYLVKLGSVAETSSGGTPQRGVARFYGGDIPWVKSGELPDGPIFTTEESITNAGLSESSSKLLPAGTLLIAMYGATVGKLGILQMPAATNQAVCAILPSKLLDRDYLFYWLFSFREELSKASFGGAQPNISQGYLRDLSIPLRPIFAQREIADDLKNRLSAIENARQAAQAQIAELPHLAHAIIRETLHHPDTETHLLGDVLDEVKRGVGAGWAGYPVLGATRSGVAPAREPVGKNPERYKPVFTGTVFYNPMRILIGSIAMVDDNDTPGITSPDYVVLRGRAGLVDSRWFYYWLRSPEGERCIASLARGAVRERMLFNRLAEGEITLPPYAVQVKASQALADIRPLKTNVEAQLRDIELLPSRLLAAVFGSTPAALEDDEKSSVDL